MEKSRSDILSEIQQTLDMLKARIAEVEEKLAALEPAAEDLSEDFPEEQAEDLPAGDAALPEDDMSPIDISIDLDDVGIQAEPVPAPAVPEDGPEALPEAVPEQVPAAEPVAETVSEPVAAPAEEPEDDASEELVLDGPVQARANINDRQERNVRKAVMDVMGQKLAWKTAMPGTPVKNVISAISLNDRVLFINTLFKEDPMAFQTAIADFNAMSSFDEAEEYVRTRFPEWNLNSDLVFRLMMAVRRKLR